MTPNLFKQEDISKNSFFLTANLSRKVRVDLEYGFTIRQNSEALTYGLGVFGKTPQNQFNLLYGLRTWKNITENHSGQRNEIHFLAGVVGGEYFFMNHFSISSELQLVAYLEDNLKGQKIFFTNSNVIVRFYF